MIKQEKRQCSFCGKNEVKTRGLCNACYLRWQRYGNCEYRRHISNADRIRKMSDDELSKFLCAIVSPPDKAINCGTCIAANYCRMGHNGFIDWLREDAPKGGADKRQQNNT